ncbi:hypothetical protein Q3G72_027233 [Acer saccharum]|nr:hypothetical protein Q3G72_027233 [Acer saccharum]
MRYDKTKPLKVRMQFLWKPYINECKERTACQCDGCSCKNSWGGFECKCKADRLYIKEHDACIVLLQHSWKVTHLCFNNQNISCKRVLWQRKTNKLVRNEPEAIADPEPEEMPYCDWLLEEKEMADRHQMSLDQRIAGSEMADLLGLIAYVHLPGDPVFVLMKISSVAEAAA